MRRLTLTLLVIMLTLLGTACGGGGNGPTPPGTTTTPPATTAAPGSTTAADLAVTFVRVYPGTPSLGQPFTVRAQVGNIGDAMSGKYDIAGTVRNVNTGAVYPVEATTMDPMQPGEDYTVLQKEVNVSDAGSYEFWLEIAPLGEDADESNNAAGWAFTVSE